MKLLLSLFLVATMLSAADINISGRWPGSFTLTNDEGLTKGASALLVLKQDGSEITGTGGPNESKAATYQEGQDR